MDEINCLMSMNSCGGGGASILSIASAPPPPPALDITVAKVGMHCSYLSAIPIAYIVVQACNSPHVVIVVYSYRHHS